MDKPLLTVIIPVYNTAEYLSRCIESVINQTEHNIEVVIIMMLQLMLQIQLFTTILQRILK